MKSVITILLMMVRARFSKFFGFWSLIYIGGCWCYGWGSDVGKLFIIFVVFIVSFLSFLYGLNMRLEDICERGFEEGNKKKS